MEYVVGIGTAVGHVAEWAPTGAVAVPVGDAEAFAREIARLLADEPRRLALAHEAHRRALAHDADHTARSFERLYRVATSRSLRAGSTRPPVVEGS